MKEVVDALAERPSCPQGHILGEGVRCSKKRCRDAPPLAADAGIISAMKVVESQTIEELALSGARTSAILKALGVPQGLEGADADEWCTKKLAEMRMNALAIQDYLMKHGTTSQMEKASAKILDITEKQGQIASVAPIIIINGAGGAALPPWRKDVVVEGVTVEGGRDGKMDTLAPVQAPPSGRKAQ